MLLHTANFFTRSLTVTERAAATKALGIQVEQMRANDPTLTGMRTEDVKARIVEEMTGRKVSGKTIKREEALAEKVAGLIPEWRDAADSGELSAKAVGALAEADEATQRAAFNKWAESPKSKAATTELVASMKASEPAADKRLASAEKALTASSRAFRETLLRRIRRRFSASPSWPARPATRCEGSPMPMGLGRTRQIRIVASNSLRITTQ